MVGCRKFKGKNFGEYQNYFNENYLDEVMDREIKIILSQNLLTKSILLSKLYKLSLNEVFLFSYQNKIKDLIYSGSYNNDDEQEKSR